MTTDNYDRTIDSALQYKENLTRSLYFEFTPQAINEMECEYEYNYNTFYVNESNPVFINGIQFDYTKNKINDPEEFKRLWAALLPATRDVLMKWCLPGEEELCYLELFNQVKDVWKYTIH